ncbi:uncharacterized protein LOC125648776 isoform X2 [Ostrea edulis]|uniref:uncharacterized protein LOC125648776 isoform X2 n=1 Tax=Ostrea edulis TaxID=37623 RepID=UPI0024AFDD08|nr:uncharacterized protein LOC125648776 isoform X2 [Ostrea edulis]
MQRVCSVFILQVVFLWIFHCHWTSASTFRLFPVDICPKNETEVEEASERLNCSFGDDKTTNEYHCVPFSNFTQLVEFCYPKTSGLIEKGLCMILEGYTLDDRNCSRFKNGCPDIHYTSETMYKFPMCSRINTEFRCYLAEPSCPPPRQVSSDSTESQNTTTEENITVDVNTAAWVIAIAILIPVVIFLSLALVYYKFQTTQKRTKERNDVEEMESLLEGQSFQENVRADEDSSSLNPGDTEITIEDYARDEKFQERFQQYLKEGSVDVCPISQIIVVGENGVGKTTLLYRLQGRHQEEIDHIQSTRGIDCHTQKFGFIVTNDQLEINKEGKSNLAVPPENVLAGGRSTGITKEVTIVNEDQKEVKKSGDNEETSSSKSNKRHDMSIEEQITGDEREATKEGDHTLQASTRRTEEEAMPEERTTTTEVAKTVEVKKSGDNEETSSSKSNKRHDMSIEEQITGDEREATKEGDHTLQASTCRTEEEAMPEERTTTTEVAKTVEVKKSGDNEETSSSKSNERHDMGIEEQITGDEREATKEGDHTLQVGNMKEESTNYSSHKQPTRDENTDGNTEAETAESVCVTGISGSYLPSKDNWVKKMMSIVKSKLAEARDIRLQLRNKTDVVLNVLDFAGQGAYYASHQTHMRKDAIYIIVFDVSRDLAGRRRDEDYTESSDNKTYLCDRPDTSFSCWTQKDYIHYWLNTIRVHGGNCENIILVGTHGDNKRSDFELKYKELLATIHDLLPEKRCEVIMDLSRKSEEEDIKLMHIKAYICKAVSSSMRKCVPAKWMKYEDVFEMIKSEKKTPVISIDDLLEMIDHMEIEMLDVEIHDMLHYFHKNGSILFFNMDRLREIIILDIQWFVDCFKHIITDREHAKEENGIVNKDVQEKWNLFFEKGLMDSSLYNNLLNAKAANLPQGHRELLGEYLQKLGMMHHIEGFEISEHKKINAWYVPCVNTKTFTPKKEKYGENEASPILCFRFEDYLPIDLFGRMIVLCLSSGKWCIVRGHLYKEGAHMLYRETDKSKSDPLQVYLFTARNIITVQVINRSTTKLQGTGVRKEIQNTIQELLSNFYACSMNCDIGFLCSKNEGYKDSSIEHFISLPSKDKYCHVCENDVKREAEQACEFWKILHKEDYTPNKMESVEGERQWIIACCQAYRKVRGKILSNFNAAKDMEFGTFYTSLLKKSDSIVTTTGEQAIDQETKMKSLDSFVDIGVQLKHLSNASYTSKRNKEQSMASIKEIAHTLKKICMTFNDEDRSLRRHFFFLWTDTVEDVQLEDIQNIPQIDLSVPKLKFGNDVKLKASVDVDASLFIWLKKNHPRNRFEILRQTRKSIFGQMRKDSFHMKRFSRDDEGHYQLIVATKKTVGRRTFELQSGTNGYTPLHEACQVGDDTTVQQLLQNGADMNVYDNKGFNPLHIACGKGHDSTVQLLLNNGADINLCQNEGASPLYIACYKGHDSTIQLLLNNGADINLCQNEGTSPLFIACQNGHDSTIQLLLNNGADINLCRNTGASPLYIACQEGHDSTVQLLLKNGTDINLCQNEGASPLYIACQNGHDSTVQLLLKNGTDINLCQNEGGSPLFIACQNGHDSTVQLLLNNGADINLCRNTGACPLFIACEKGRDNKVQLLLNNGADINLCDNNGVSPLIIACQEGHDSTVQLLLNNGADINLCQNEGSCSPLYIACENGHDSTVQLLLNNGADINLCNNNGASPLFIACEEGHDSTVQLLLNDGADINLCQNDGTSPLGIARQNKRHDVVEVLLRKLR